MIRFTVSIFKISVFLLLALTIASPTSPSQQCLYKLTEEETGVDRHLLQAIAMVESSEISQAVNIDDPSFGLMQIYCPPDITGKCTNNFPALGDTWEGMTVEELFDPEVNLKVGAEILRWNINTYGYAKGIAVYNARSARYDPEEGPFVNQRYVDKVIKLHSQLKGRD